MDKTKKIAWQCRRGMLELDLIFEKFYREQYPHLPPDEQAIFEQLLQEPDPVLASWVFQYGQPTQVGYCHLIAKMLSV